MSEEKWFSQQYIKLTEKFLSLIDETQWLEIDSLYLSTLNRTSERIANKHMSIKEKYEDLEALYIMFLSYVNVLIQTRLQLKGHHVDLSLSTIRSVRPRQREEEMYKRLMNIYTSQTDINKKKTKLYEAVAPKKKSSKSKKQKKGIWSLF